jgi:hypothetical protein
MAGSRPRSWQRRERMSFFDFKQPEISDKYCFPQNIAFHND